MNRVRSVWQLVVQYGPRPRQRARAPSSLSYQTADSRLRKEELERLRPSDLDLTTKIILLHSGKRPMLHSGKRPMTV